MPPGLQVVRHFLLSEEIVGIGPVEYLTVQSWPLSHEDEEDDKAGLRGATASRNGKEEKLLLQLAPS